MGMRSFDRIPFSTRPSFHITSAVVFVDTTSTATLDKQTRIRLMHDSVWLSLICCCSGQNSFHRRFRGSKVNVDNFQTLSLLHRGAVLFCGFSHCKMKTNVWYFCYKFVSFLHCLFSFHLSSLPSRHAGTSIFPLWFSVLPLILFLCLQIFIFIHQHSASNNGNLMNSYLHLDWGHPIFIRYVFFKTFSVPVFLICPNHGMIHPRQRLIKFPSSSNDFRLPSKSLQS